MPAFLCLYAPIWYAFNLFLVTSLVQDKSFVFWSAIFFVAASLVIYLIFIGIWRLVLKIFWSKPPLWTYPQSWKSIFMSWAIASFCLILAMLFEPRLWDNPRLILQENDYYVKRLVEDTLGKIIVIWLAATTTVYSLKK
ncbi:hypothetical protein [Pseudanabaena sp. ABRG5-3]|uniref:hypothetical protein n=1 Tax=Pseudanabaena sp. ABRG5-3 TaxID=685565 RepID=UPI0011AE6D4A|nr:hypothetical protein [Pseudanabaena sp. ABRG5-3]